MICNENSIAVTLQVVASRFSTAAKKTPCCISPGSLSGTHISQQKHLNHTHDNQRRTNILGPKHFIVEEENEALLAKELEEAKIQSAHNSHSSMHSSQPHVFHLPATDSLAKDLKVMKMIVCLRKDNVDDIICSLGDIVAQ
jgi:hypothetical protein